MQVNRDRPSSLTLTYEVLVSIESRVTKEVEDVREQLVAVGLLGLHDGGGGLLARRLRATSRQLRDVRAR